jgi:hypothetical protein
MLHGRDAGVITCKSSMIQRHSVVLFGTYPGAKSRTVGSPLCLGSFSVADVAGCMTTQVLLKYLQAVAACAATDILCLLRGLVSGKPFHSSAVQRSQPIGNLRLQVHHIFQLSRKAVVTAILSPDVLNCLTIAHCPVQPGIFCFSVHPSCIREGRPDIQDHLRKLLLQECKQLSVLVMARRSRTTIDAAQIVVDHHIEQNHAAVKAFCQTQNIVPVPAANCNFLARTATRPPAWSRIMLLP